MNFPSTVYHRDFGPMLVHCLEDLLNLAITYGLGWHSDPVAAARGEHFDAQSLVEAANAMREAAAQAELASPVAVTIDQLTAHADPGPLAPAAAVIHEKSSVRPVADLSEAELEVLTAPEKSR